MKDNISITAIILAANTDFGRCRLATTIPPALWPIMDEPVVNRLLNNLSCLPVKKAVICCNGNKDLLRQKIEQPDSMELSFLDEKMPFGTAGCIRDAAKFSDDEIFIVTAAQIANLPDLKEAIIKHRNNQAVLTIISGNNRNLAQAAQIYIANSSILESIPQKGYFDIKENLIPVLIRQGKKVILETMPLQLHTFRNHNQYLDTVYSLIEKNQQQDVFISEKAQVSPKAKILGPAIILDNSKICDDAVIAGPVVIGKNVVIESNSFIEQSILWDGSAIGKNCVISNCVVNYNTTIAANNIVKNKAIVNNIKEPIKNLVASINPPFAKIAAIIILAVVFIWSYLPQIKDLFGVWSSSDDYSAGILVPFLAAFIMWSGKRFIIKISGIGLFAGILLFIAAQAIRFFGLYFMYSSAERLSVVLSIWSVIIIIFGFKLFYKNLAALAFLLLMLPPPHIIHNSIMLPLQKTATVGAAFCLEMLGYVVSRQGNILYVNNNAVAVSEACNGLRMITAFLIIAVFISLIIKKNRWEKLLLLLSSLPIAFACNIARLTLTAIAYTADWGHRWAELIHNFSGYAMVPLAIVMVIIEIWLINVFSANPEKT